jgi:two-component system NarL family response regulator
MLKAESITCDEREQRESFSVRTFLISDHRLFIDTIADLMCDRKDFSIIGSITGFGLAQQCFKKIQSSSVDIVLIDATMKEADAVQITRKLTEDLPDAKIVILGLEHDEETILRFVEAGAVGYVLKQASLEDIASTIIAIHNGHSPCSSRIAATLFNRMAQLARLQNDPSPTQQVSLTIREKEILRLMSDGLSNKDIASHLNIALHTVKNHVHNILEKFQVHYRREAIGLAHKHGLIDRAMPSVLGLVKALALLAGQFLSIAINSLIDRFNCLT